MIKTFKAFDKETGEYTEYLNVEEYNEFDMFITAINHVEAKYEKKVTAHMTTEYFNKIIRNEDCNKVIMGIPVVIDDEQEIELIVKY